MNEIKDVVLLSTIFLFLLITIPSGNGISSADYINNSSDNNNCIILVSDNYYDNLSAQCLNNIVNCKIVYTKWGVFDKDVVYNIKKQKPNQIFIIGGPMAVPYDYTKSLAHLKGVRINRLYGKDRFETNRAVLNYILNNYNSEEYIHKIYIINCSNYTTYKSIFNNYSGEGILTISYVNNTINIDEYTIPSYNASEIILINISINSTLYDILHKHNEYYFSVESSSGKLVFKKNNRAEHIVIKSKDKKITPT